MRLRTLALVLVIFLPALLGAQTVLYVASGSGNLSKLYTVDPTTATPTLIGDILVGGTTPVTVTGMAFEPSTGVLWGVTGNEYAPSRKLITIDPATGVAAIVGGWGSLSADAASDISFRSNGTLYYWKARGGPLGTLDLTTAANALFGNQSNGTQGNGLAFTPNGNLYVAGPETGSLYLVNPTSGALSVVAPLSNVPLNFGLINGMASDASGTLFVVGKGSSQLLATINPNTGAMTSIGNLGFDSDALAFRSIPEPSSVALLGSGLVLALIRFRRRIFS